MCGIAGILNIQNKNINNSEIIKKMTNSISHRGPDDSNILCNNDKGIYFGHTRLSILDLSINGSQPMKSYSERYTLVFNGEIYNHIELRNKIDKFMANNKEYIKWNGHSDTETLINSFEVFGVEKTLKNIEGMFSIALWDDHEECLYLIRDMFGEKPLYYGWIGGDFIFGSELKTIKAHPLFDNEIDQNAKSLYLNLNYVPSPFTIYKDIFKLSPSSYLKIPMEKKLSHSKIQITNWSNKRDAIKQYNKEIYSNSFDKNTQILNEQLKQTISKFMIADVEIGVFLSSGIDSSIISAITNEISKKPIKTFTIGFEDHRYDESKDAKKIAKSLKTDHYEKIFSKKDLLDIVPNLINIYDEPFADSSQLPTILLSGLASENVKVALSGDGGDEFFGGYNRYILSDKYLRFLQLFPDFSKNILSKLIMIIPKEVFSLIEKFLNFTNLSNQSLLYEKAFKVSNKLKYTNSPFNYYLSMVSEWYGNEILENQDKNLNQFFNQKFIDGLKNEQLMMYIDTITYLPDDILCKVDRASMSKGLEVRVPFLDKDIYELSCKIPQDQKIHKGTGKVILRNLLRKYLPEKLILKNKKGFGIPIGDLLKTDLKELVDYHLQKEKLAKSNLNYSKINNLWEQHLSGKFNNQHKIWNILIFQNFIENQ